MAESNTSNDSPLIGCIVLLGLLIGGGIGVYKYFFPSTAQPLTTSLSAFFVDDSGNPIVTKEAAGGRLKIKGQAYQAGKPLPAGTVEVTVNTLDDSFRQSISVELKSGQFETDAQAFRSLSPADRLHVTANVTGTDTSNVFTGSKEIFLNTAAPTFTSFQTIIIWVIVGLLLVAILSVFFTTFTGQRTPNKNRYAIIFSYLFGGVFLAVPLLAPVLLLQVFPNVRRTMVGMPVGLVLTRVGTGEEAKNQWALNIGGFSKIAPPADSTAEAPAVPTATATPTPVRQGSPTATPRATATPTPTLTPAAASASPATQTPSPAASPTRQPTESPRPSPTPRRIGQDSHGEAWNGIVEVEGGLLIPLYVIILSVIGGAINMTRKVPRFQGEGEYSQPTNVSISPMSPIKRVTKTIAGKVRGMFKKEPLISVSSPEAVADSHRAAETPAAPPPSPSVLEPTKPAVSQPVTTPAAKKQQADPEVPLEVQAEEIDTDINDLVKVQLRRSGQTRKAIAQINRLLQDMQKLFEQRTEDERRLLGFDSFDEWLSNRVAVKEVLGTNWRVELLNQYMYLISAPFLAIVAYYILDLLGLNKQAVLVVISFSVGLISERILNWILGIAGNYLRGSKTQAGAS